jgi:hypothetical protein
VRNHVILRTDDGEAYALAGYASQVQEKVNAARGEGKLIPLERDVIPTGQMIWIDPDHVVVIRDAR